MKYKCNKCGKIVERKSRKIWMPSFCEKLGETTRLYRVKKPNRSK